MAEYLLRKRLGQQSDWKVRSAGTAGLEGIAATPAAVTAVDELGIDMTGHKSSPLTRSAVDEAGVIVVMTAGHHAEVAHRFPDVMSKVFLMMSFCDGAGLSDVADPIGMPLPVYVITRDEIDSALPGLMEYLKRLDSE
jgi:protein-tyrosine-phosphatase